MSEQDTTLQPTPNRPTSRPARQAPDFHLNVLNLSLKSAKLEEVAQNLVNRSSKTFVIVHNGSDYVFSASADLINYYGNAENAVAIINEQVPVFETVQGKDFNFAYGELSNSFFDISNLQETFEDALQHEMLGLVERLRGALGNRVGVTVEIKKQGWRTLQIDCDNQEVEIASLAV